eukprot:246584_1
MSLCFELLLALNFFVVIINSANIIIDTKLGKINGTVHKANSSKTQDVYSFYGIQYANTPIGDLRFRPSTVNASLWNGIYDGTRFGDQCVQGGVLPQSENCLFINIWTSKPNNTGTLLPVMFFIHGGGFYVGAGSNAEYNGINFVSTQKDFVYVSINYRLAALGFLSNKQIYDEDPNWKSYGGLNGVNDQITALKWVKSYISDYGGDANQVTIFGESAGGQSVCYLTISPPAKGLFKRAISESGACAGPWGAGPTTFALDYCDASLARNGLKNNITYLRTLPAKTLLELAVISAVDGMVLTDEPVNIYNNLDKYNNILNPEKLIVGYNTLDGLAGLGYLAYPTTDAEYKEFLDVYVPNKDHRDLIYSYYYPSTEFPYYAPMRYNSYSLAWFMINSDTCLLCPSFTPPVFTYSPPPVNQYVGNDIVYIYDFGGTGNNNTYYALHSAELPFVFDAKEFNIGSGFPWSQTLSNQMMSAWTNFAKYGIPNITDPANWKNDITWPLYSGSTNKTNVMIFEDKVKVNSTFYKDYRKNVCDFWYNQVAYDVILDLCLDQYGIP